MTAFRSYVLPAGRSRLERVRRALPASYNVRAIAGDDLIVAGTARELSPAALERLRAIAAGSELSSELSNPWPDPCKLPDAVDEYGFGIHPLSSGSGCPSDEIPASRELSSELCDHVDIEDGRCLVCGDWQILERSYPA